LDRLTSDISVVIPTFNSSKTIAKCLKSIKCQTSYPSEVIVIDRFSKDGTASIARTSGATVIQVEANRSVARNIGLARSSSTNVLFVDSDMILSPIVVEECVHSLDEHDALVIPEVSIGNSFWAKCRALERAANIENPQFEAARCFHKTAFASVGEYNPDLESWEDLDLHNRVISSGLSLGRIGATIFHDEGNFALIAALRKKYFYGKAFGKFMRANPTAGIKWINPLQRIVLPSLHVSVSSLRYGVGILIMRSLEWGAAGLGYLAGRQQRGRLQIS
jgi:glycosyltransferase involved in cell wall biosynthesis